MTVALLAELDPGATLPKAKTEHAAGLDLTANVDCGIRPGEWAVVSTGLKVAIPKGCAGLILPRSGMALNEGVTVLNAPGLIDPDYRGEVGVCLINHSEHRCEIEAGQRIAQLVIVPTVPVVPTKANLDPTERGEGGWGSTGR